MYHRFGHLNKVIVKKGEKIEKHSLLGQVGGTGGWVPHLHWDICKYNQGTSYIVGWSKEKVKENYIEPKDYLTSEIPTRNDDCDSTHNGYWWLDDIGNGYHPGYDLNKGTGSYDLGQWVYSPCAGEVEYVYDGVEKNGGWGKLIIIKENNMTEEQEKNYKKIAKAVAKKVDYDYGDNPSDKETKELIDELDKAFDSLDSMEIDLVDEMSRNTDLNQKIQRQAEMLSAREATIAELREKTGDIDSLTITQLIKVILNRILKS